MNPGVSYIMCITHYEVLNIYQRIIHSTPLGINLQEVHNRHEIQQREKKKAITPSKVQITQYFSRLWNKLTFLSSRKLYSRKMLIRFAWNQTPLSIHR